MNLFRYPGGKSKIIDTILDRLESLSRTSSGYIEPFFGGGSVGVEVIKRLKFDRYIFNDLDAGIISIWFYVLHQPESLINFVRNYKPTPSDFYLFRDFLLRNQTMSFDAATMKLAIHQMSFSGLGVKSGGPLGGKTQDSKYKVDCRWNPSALEKRILKFHSLMASRENISCYNQNYLNLISNIKSPSTIYLDPPYYIKGNELYQKGFSELDHKELSEFLKTTNHSWLLSYDDCPEIRELYKWAKIEEISLNYSIKTARTKKELLICKG